MSTYRTNLVCALLAAAVLGGGAAPAQTTQPAPEPVPEEVPEQAPDPAIEQVPDQAPEQAPDQVPLIEPDTPSAPEVTVPSPTNALPFTLSTNAMPRAGTTNTPPVEAATVEEMQNVYEDIALLTEAMLIVRRHYVDALDYRRIVYSAIHGMLSGLDPHSDFLEPKASEDMKEETEAQFGGIGIQIGMRSGLPLVIAPIEDSPAYAAGLLAGDMILAIEGQPAMGLNMEQVMNKLRGAPGTSVTVTIGREGGDPFDVTLVRDVIKVASVKGERVLRNNVGYLRITQFSEPTGSEVAAALERLATNELAGLVLDLRDNPGGLLSQAIAVAEQFLPEKAVIVTTRGREGVHESETFRAGAGKRRLDGVPVAILINRGTASAAEIVTGALQDARRAIVLGSKSFGKASVQKIMPLATREKCHIKLTAAHYYTPSGRMIHGTGIEPDIEVPMTPGEWRRARMRRDAEERPAAYTPEQRAEFEDAVDVQLERAIDALVAVRIFSADRETK